MFRFMKTRYRWMLGAMVVAMAVTQEAGAAGLAERIGQYESLPVVPRLSTLALAQAGDPENRRFREFLTAPPTDPQALSGKRIAVLSTDGVEEIELTGVVVYFKERGAKVDLVAPRHQSLPAKYGVQYPEQRKTHILTVRFMENASWVKVDRFLDEVKPADYDAVVIPGGAWNPDILRHDPRAVAFVQAMHGEGKVTAALCHGPLVFVNAGLIEGRRVTGYWNIQVDLKNAGATVEDKAVVVDGNLVTSRFPYDLPQFAEAIASLLTAR